jgi:hypothetical protein
MTPADTASRRLGPGAIALVLDELDRLPRVDDRYRRWPWSQRALAQRRRCSPGTVHKHHQALAAAGVLVTDDHGRTLVDTTRLQHARHDEAPPTCGRRRRSTTASHSQRPDDAPAGGEADVLVAIEALTKAVEARPDLAGALTQLIGRLARLLEHPPATSSAPVARPQPRDDESRARGHCGGDLAADLGRCAGTAARPTARDRAPLKKERTNTHTRTTREMVIYLVFLSLLATSRARWAARDRGARR